MILLVFLCASIGTLAEAYSNCPKVSFVIPYQNRTCIGSVLRASGRNRTYPGAPNAGGRKMFSLKTGFYLYTHILSGGQRFVSIRWARNPQFALADENGQLQFRKVTNPQSATPPDKFLLSRRFLSLYRQGFQTKSSNRYISYDNNNCSVHLQTLRQQTATQNYRFVVTCKPNLNRCFC